MPVHTLKCNNDKKNGFQKKSITFKLLMNLHIRYGHLLRIYFRELQNENFIDDFPNKRNVHLHLIRLFNNYTMCFVSFCSFLFWIKFKKTKN